MLDPSYYIIFHYPTSTEDLSEPISAERKCQYRLGSYNRKLVNRLLLYNGLVLSEDNNYSLIWGSSPESDNVSPSSVFQRINHFPYSKQILGNKAELAYIIQSHPNYSDFEKFFPTTFILPADRDALFRYMRLHQNMQFIAKPPEGSCGHGIKIVTYSDFYNIPHGSVVSQYITRPLCIDGFKFDMRIYVLVTSFAPLRAFVYKEGLGRFATDSYSVMSNNVYSYLTNATLNKKSRKWCSDFKWKLTDLLFEIEHRWHKQPSEIMEQILDTVATTLALVQHAMAPNERKTIVDPFFELYGFDLLLDKDFRMWLLEVNTFPSMGFDEDVDFEVKAPLIAQALSIAGIPDADLQTLKRMQSEAEIPENYDEYLIKQEDERNVASGDGFIRLFPSEMTEDLEDLLTFPKLVIPKRKQKRTELSNPKKLGKMLSSSQGLDVLILYLTKIQKKLVENQLDEEAEAKVVSFLKAQGYQIKNNSPNLKPVLKNFIVRQKARNDLTDNDDTIPDSIKKQLMESEDDFIFQLLLNCDLPLIKNIRTLFY